MANLSKLMFGAAIVAATIATPALAAHKGNPTSVRQNGYAARSHPCNYRDFHMWDQTYHCNE
jgi:hypothetical protein